MRWPWWHLVRLVPVLAPAVALAQDAAPAQPPSPGDDEDLRQQVRRLEKRVADLESGPAQEQPAARPPSALEAAVQSIDLSGYAEILSSYNFRSGSSQLRAADEDETGFTFRNVRLTADKPLTTNGSAGFRVQLDYGTAAEVENADPNFAFGDTLAVPEAFIAWRAPFAPTDHVDLTVGRFRTWFGWETLESDQNWLVTRNPIAVYGTPITHTGLRAVAPVADKVEAGLAYVNGWDEVRDVNDGKTGLAHLAFGPYEGLLSSTIQLCASYGAVENPNAHEGDKRRFFEFEWNGKFSEPLEFALDAIWGDMPDRSWHGAAAYLRHHATERLVFSVRVGRYADEALGTDGARVADVSLAVAYELVKDLQVALEYRHDYSGSDGTFVDASGGPSHHQDTLTASFLYRF